MGEHGMVFGKIRIVGKVYDPARSRNYCCQDKNWKAQIDMIRNEQVDKSRDSKELEVEVSQSVKTSAGSEKLKPAVVLSYNNLERFMKAVTPVVPTRYLSKVPSGELINPNEESQPYFTLGDLWDSFKEWSAFGAGVPLIMNENKVVFQYYTPFLSAIQLYGDSSSSFSSSRQSEDGDLDAFRYTTSGSNSGYDFQRARFNVKLHKQTLIKNGMERRSSVHWHYELQGDSSHDSSQIPDSQGQLLFEYFEEISPYHREPLADKISDLARVFPQISSLKSCDLLSSSWMSVAWYPIYMIPNGPKIKDLDACFLTFHSLHTSTIGASNRLSATSPYMCPVELCNDLPEICLPTFGLSTYKFSGGSWVPYGGSEHPLVRSLEQSAYSWLTRHKVSHPDFLHFIRR